MHKIFNFWWGTITVVINEAKEGEAVQPSQMLCYDTIGKDPWSGGGMSALDFVKALNDVPKDRDLHIHVNSPGGDVHEGFTMKSNILNWKNITGKKVITVIDGVAASTASWAFPTASDEVWANKGSQVFVHPPMAFGSGTAEDFENIALNLRKTGDQIAGMYADYSGKSKKSWAEKMDNETLMTSEEALDCGLVDKILDTKSVRNFSTGELASMRNRLTAFYNSVAERGGEPKQNKNIMNKEKIIAMLNGLGVKDWDGKPITKDTSDEHLEAALNSVLAKPAVKIDPTKPAVAAPTMEQFNALLDQVKQQTEFANTAKTLRITSEINKLVTDDKLTEKEKAPALKRALADETYLDELKARMENKVGGNPLKPLAELVGNSFNEVQAFIKENSTGFMSNFIGNRVDGPIGKSACEEIKNRGILVANTIKKYKDMLVSMYNANTIDAGLQRQIILQEMLEEFAIVLLPLQNFSTVFRNVPLEGTDTVDVPFYPLATDAGNSWDPTTGYASAGIGGTVTNARPVVVGGAGGVGGAGVGANAPAGTAKDRKWVAANFSSYEMDRQPYLNVQKLMIQKANRLAVLIFGEIIGKVITLANFGASIKAVPAAEFSGDDIADLWENTTGRNWPVRGRSLILDHRYNTPLIKDPTFKQYLAYGATDPLRKAKIQEAYGFEDIAIVPNLASYSPGGAAGTQGSENLIGLVVWMYAVLCAFAPIMPTPDVRALMTRYDVVVHPSLGASFEYRRFGNVTLDQTTEVVESSYGANYGVQSALARLTSQ